MPSERTRVLLEAMEAANNCIVVADARQKDQPLIYVNRGFRRVTGYATDEAVGKNCRFLQDPPEGHSKREPDNFDAARQERELEVLRTGIRQKRPCVALLRNFRKDGTPFWNELYLTPVMNGDDCIAIIGVQNDVTDRVNAQSRLLEVQEMEQQRLARDLHDTVAQDLQALSLRAQLLGLDAREGKVVPQDISERLDEVITYAKSAAEKARTISHRLMPTARDATNLPTGLHRVTEEASRVWNIETKFETDGHIEDVAHEDLIHFSRIVQEAAANAVRHGGATRMTVRVEATSPVEVPGRGGVERPGLVLTVRDNGSGLPDHSEPNDVGIGIETMRTRAGLVGGDLTIRNLGTGVEVRVAVAALDNARIGDNRPSDPDE